MLHSAKDVNWVDQFLLAGPAAADSREVKALSIVLKSPLVWFGNERIESRLPGIVEIVLDRFDIEGLADFLHRPP